MGGPRDILNYGARISGKIVASPESAPTLDTDGYPVAITLDSGIAILPPFVLCMVDIVGGTNPLAEVHFYAYYHDATTLSSKWQRIKTAVVNNDVMTYVLMPVIGCRRFDVVVTNIEGSPTSVNLDFRGISKDTADLIHVIESELRPVSGAGAEVAVTTSAAVRIGPLAVDRTYHYFADQICFMRIGDVSVVATSTDFPIQAGPVYAYVPRTSSEQYISFLASSGDGSVWYGQAN